jgi:hypothetical protein
LAAPFPSFGAVVSADQFPVHPLTEPLMFVASDDRSGGRAVTRHEILSRGGAVPHPPASA